MKRAGNVRRWYYNRENGRVRILINLGSEITVLFPTRIVIPLGFFLGGVLNSEGDPSLGILLVSGLLTRPAAFVAFLFLASLWVSEWGTSWIWELLVPVLASLGLAVGRAGRAWGIDALLARRRPSSPWWG